MLADPPPWLEGKRLTITDPVLLVDPHWAARDHDYPADASPQGMRADLERLLKYAWTG
jgi:hypothetical protein